MPSYPQDISGMTFGRLLAIKRTKRKDKSGTYYWDCKCSCGNPVTTLITSLKRGATKSCGCFNREQNNKHIIGNTYRKTHGESYGKNLTIEYYLWQGMLRRCSPNSREEERKNYYERGIRVCKRWLKFENFLKDMGRRPSSDLSIDRINNDGNYCKSNCRWATAKQQANNRRSRYRS